jgi:hypothetical protein
MTESDPNTLYVSVSDNRRGISLEAQALIFERLYQDTDSVIVDQRGADVLESVVGMVGDGIGQLRKVGEYDECILRGVKNYTINGRHVISGVRKRDTEIADMKWTCERFERVSALFCRNPDGTIRTHFSDMDTPGTNLEGYQQDSGWCMPVELSEQTDWVKRLA